MSDKSTNGTERIEVHHHPPVSYRLRELFGGRGYPTDHQLVEGL